MRKTATLLALLLAALTTTGCSVLEREYPSADPATLSQRLTDRAQWAYDGMTLPPHKAVRPVRVIPSHSCYAGGLSIEKTLPDVVAFDLSWTVEDIPADVARATEARLRRKFTSAGWALIHDGNRRGKDFVEFGFRVQDPATGDQFDLAWNNLATSLFLSGYTSCAKVPQPTADNPSPKTWRPQTV
ncbi:hypothetical protein AB0A94_15905 [Streptomyces sp. NPDC044984]|uniref:hypothetical protein n=1 Tax=Streptomyces sp. NPDC044984 TaxID=3154335 RepID=UPI0033EDD4AB